MTRSSSHDVVGTKRTFTSLQVLRGLAALFVTLHHYVQMVLMAKPKGAVATFLLERGPIAVDIFFILSGFIMAYSAEGYRGQGGRFLVNRFVRVMPNYWLYTIILLVSVALLPSTSYLTDWNPASLWHSLVLIPYPNPNGFGDYPFLFVGWTLAYEMFFYTVLGFALWLPKRWYFAVTCIGLGILPFVLRGHNLLGQGNGYLSEFAAGMLLLPLTDWIGRLRPKYSLGILTLWGLSVIVWLANSSFDHLARMQLALWLVAACLLYENFFRHSGFVMKGLVRMGDLSYSIYLSHVIILGWVITAYGKPTTMLGHTVAISTFLLVVWLLSSLTFRFVETGIFPKVIRTRLENLLRVRGR
jgi:exopolysaccharide production protein ExoZ